MRAILVLAAAAILVASGPALAKKRHRHHGRTYTAERVYTPRAQAGVCQPWCEFDLSPCDPVEFKRADGRCANPVADGTTAIF